MIHVDRSAVGNPYEVNPKLAERAKIELQKYQEFLKEGESKQRRYIFKAYQNSQIREALNALFHSKCAYCESKIDVTQAGDIEHFRPKSSVVERPDHPGYWWLANSWENLLIACVDCNRPRRQKGPEKTGMSGKGNRFPLMDEKRRVFEAGQESYEDPLLLDPTVDYPEEHLVYNEEGYLFSDTKRGNTTISVLGLNRPRLVSLRENAIKMVGNFISIAEIVESTVGIDPSNQTFQNRLKEQAQELNELADASQEFAGLKRQLIRPVLARLESLMEAAPVKTEWETATPKVSQTRKKQAKRASQAYQHEMADYSLENLEGISKYRLQRRLINRITMHNVRGIRDLDLDLSLHGDGRTPWHMLLGENGTGKSTVLQAVALVLVGAEYFSQLAAGHDVHPASFVRYRCRSGWIKVQLSGFPNPHELIFHRDRLEFKSPTGETTLIFVDEDGLTRVEGEHWSQQTVLLGYGATRLLPRRAGDLMFGGDFARVDNLFDPFVPLFNAEDWLLKLKPNQFNDAALVLKDLLALPDDAELLKTKGTVVVKAFRTRTPLKHLSDGYQTIVAATVDILEVAMRLWPNLADAEGIVLLDEIGAHLHPTWKMQIVRSLKRALPGMQFIATTHQPLCLRGLDAGEVIVMQRDQEDEIVAISDLPSPGDFRVDQLLTSEFFGLNSTVDPEVERLFDEYYALLALEARTDDQEALLANLQNDLEERRYLGNTLRENLMYEVIDKLVARQKSGNRKPSAEVKQEAVQQVSQIWQEMVIDQKGNQS